MAGQADVKTTPWPLATAQALQYQLVPISWQLAVRMQKKKHVPRGNTSTRVHLSRSATPSPQHSVGKPACQLWGPILTTPVDHNQLVTTGADTGQPVKTRLNVGGLVEGGHND